MREKYLSELVIAMNIGNAITVVLFALVHQIFTNTIETIVFMVATYFIAVYGSWTVIEVVDEERDRRKG